MDVDKYTKEQAKEYADNEAEIQGFAKNPSQTKWQQAYNGYIEFAKSTMSVGRNPRMAMNPSLASFKPIFFDLFSSKGISGEIAKNYVGGKMSEEAVEQRILSAVTNLVKLFEAGKLGNKTRAKDKYGKMPNSEMTDFQLPKKSENMSAEQYKLLSNQVLKRWITRDLLTALVLESLMPFFLLTPKALDDILNTLQYQNITLKEYQDSTRFGERWKFLKFVIAKVKTELADINFGKILGRG